MATSRALTDWLEGFMNLTENSEPPYTYRLWTGMSVIAACLKRKCILNWGTMAVYPNMYIVLVGPSGKCRKGTAMGPGLRFLKEMGIKVAAESITREALIRELKQSNDTQVDITTGTMHLHASLTIYSQELTVFLGYNNQALMSDLTDWYDCRDTWTYRTKNMGTDEIIGVWVNLIGATTPELLQTTLPRDAIGGGLTSRIIFVFEQKKGKVVPAPFWTQKEQDLYVKLARDLEKICIMSGEFKVSSDFIDIYVPWYSAYSIGPPPFDDYRFSGYFERRPTHLLKLCILVSASRSDKMIITAEDFKRSLLYLEMIEKKMPYTFSGVGKSSSADVLQRVMGTMSVVQEIDFGDLMSRFYQDMDKIGMEKIVECLKSMGVVETEVTANRRIIKYIKGNKVFELD